MRVFIALAVLVCAVSAGTVVDAVVGNPSLSTLASLLKSADLVTALSGDGPFTVFAPTNAAFAKLPAYEVKYLTAADNAAILKGVLEYHVASGNLSMASFTDDEKIPTLQGSDVFIEFIDGTNELGMDSATCQKNVHFVNTQVVASNGIVHVIDTVFIPPAVICPDALFFVEQRGQQRVGYEGFDCRAKGTEQLSQGEVKPVGIAVDSNTHTVFWSNDENNVPNDSWLTSASYASSDLNITKFVQSVYDPQGMDTDTKNKKLYFAEHNANRVRRVNYDGTDLELFWQGRNNSDYPADVAVDADAGLVFTTVQSVMSLINGSVHVQNLDGTGFQTVATGLTKNYGLCVDTYARHLYYIQGGNGGSITCHAYGSTPCNTPDKKDGPIATGLQYPYMCAVDNLWAKYGGPTRVVFSEPNVPGSVYMVDNDGSNTVLLASDLDAPMGIKLGCHSL